MFVAPKRRIGARIADVGITETSLQSIARVRERGTLWNDNELKVKTLVPPNILLMGSPNEEFNGHALGQVPVKLTKGFWIGETQTCLGETMAVVDEQIQSSQDSGTGAGWRVTKGVTTIRPNLEKGIDFPYLSDISEERQCRSVKN